MDYFFKEISAFPCRSVYVEITHVLIYLCLCPWTL